MSISVPVAPHWLDGSTDRVVIEGPDALTYLQSQVSQEIRDLGVGEARWTLLLAPTGKVEVLGLLRRVNEESFALEVDPGFGEVALARVERFKIRVRAETRLEVATGAVSAAAEAERVRVGWPRMGTEILPGETIPAETGLVGVAVNFAKGCYPGQELVERMDARGATAPRSLRRLKVDQGAQPGDPVRDSTGAEVGWLTSVAGDIALGYVGRASGEGEPVVWV